tara:strand:- start:543 stop:914 length:372 start_codon:yes stop_codon:yes gene_type:complete
MSFSKMDRNDKIEMCFDKIIDLELLDDKIETSASGVAQAKATLKQQMKRNKTAVFNAMLEALSMTLCGNQNSSVRTFKMKQDKDRQIHNLELRLADLEYKMKLQQEQIKKQEEWIEMFKASHS